MGSVLVAAIVMLQAGPLLAQQGLEAPPEQQSVGQLLFNARHQILLGDFDLAANYINTLLARNPKGAEVIKAIEDDAVLAKDLNVLLRRASRAEHPELRKSATALLDLIEKGYGASGNDPEIITKQINALAGTGRGAEQARARLREMAPGSIPLMLRVLFDGQQANLRPHVVAALPEMGRWAVEPMCAALSANGAVPAKIDIVQALGQIGYPHAIPYIQQLAQQTDSQQLKDVCQETIRQLARSPRAEFTGNAGQMFYQLGDDYYADQPSLRPKVSTGNVPVWYWDQNGGLVLSIEVPAIVYNEVMAKRCLAQALKLDSDQPNAVALWVAADVRRSAELPAKATDPSLPANYPGWHYYAVAAGPRYLLLGLARAIDDVDAKVALGLVRALNDVGFVSADGVDVSPLTMALFFPDRRVRYEAAMAIANMHARTKLPGAESVVPILAQAVSQTGEKFAVVLMPEGKDRDGLVAQIKAAGYSVRPVATRKAAFEAARASDVPNVDLLVVSYEVGEGGLLGLLELRKDYRFRFAPTLLASPSVDRAEVAAKDVKAVEAINVSAQSAEISQKVAAIQASEGDTGMSPDEATRYALRAAMALRDVALSASPGMDFTFAVPALIRALSDSRGELAVAAADALSYGESVPAQRALAQAALDGKLDAGRRVEMFRALANSAKRFGNKLTDEQVTNVVKTAMTEPNVELRDAAAQAVGALNLPSVKIDTLIIQAQPKL